MNKQNLIVWVLFAVLCSFYILLFIFIPVKSSISPDESQVVFFLDNYKNTGKFTWGSTLNEEFDTEFFRPRGTVEIRDNVYAPLVSPHYLIILSLFSTFIPLELFFLMVSLLGISFFFLLSREIYSTSKSIFLSGLVAIFPPFIFYSLSVSDIIFSTTILIISLFFLFKYDRDKDTIYLAISLIFFVLAVAIRIHNAIFFVFYLPFIIPNIRKILRKENIPLILISFLFILMLLFVNYVTYNSFLTTGRVLTGDSLEERSIYSKLLQHGLNFSTIITAHDNYLLSYAAPFYLFAILSILMLFLSKNRIFKKIKWPFIIVLIFSLLYYGSNDTFFNFYRSVVQGSLSRYFLALYLLMLLFLGLFIPKVKPNYTKSIIIFSIIISYILFSFPGNYFPAFLNHKQTSLEINEWAKQLPDNSVFLVKQFDKYVIPYGTVMLIYEESDLIDYPLLEDLYPLIKPEECLRLINELQSNGYDVYITTERTSLIRQIEMEGYQLKRINGAFYRIEKR